MIAVRLRASPRNPFNFILDSGHKFGRDGGLDEIAATEPRTLETEPGPTLIARVTLARYDQFGDFGAMEFDPLHRIKMIGYLDLIDGETGRTLVSRTVVRIMGLGGFDDLSGFNRSRSPLTGRRSVRIHGLDPTYSKVRLLERAFTSAVVREILTLVPARPSALKNPSDTTG